MSVVYISEDDYDSQDDDSHDSQDDYDVEEEIIRNIINQAPKTIEEVVNQVCQEVRQKKIIMGRYTMMYLINEICNKLKIHRAL